MPNSFLARLHRGICPTAILATLLALTLTPTFAADARWRKDLPCGKDLPQMQETPAGNWKQLCTTLPQGRTLCAQMTDEEKSIARFTLLSGRKLIKQWELEITPSPLFVPESFRMTQADLDGDGQDEILLAIQTLQGQGLGIEQWELYAMFDQQISDAINVEDYGGMSQLVCAPGQRGAMLLRSEWHEGSEPQRGDGLYITGRWYQLNKMSIANTPSFFSTVSGRPSIYQRLLFSLEKRRLHAMESTPRKPVRWYQDKNTQVVIGPYPMH